MAQVRLGMGGMFGTLQPPQAAPPPAFGSSVSTLQGPLTRNTPPSAGPYVGTNLTSYFGSGFDPRDPLASQRMAASGPFNRTSPYEQYGAGAYGLPAAFAGWSGPARNAELNATLFQQQSQPAVDLYRRQMNTDWSSVLQNQAADTIGTSAANAERANTQALARSGYGGGGAVSPFMASQLEAESMARAGQLGVAARASVLQGQQMQAEAGRNYLNSIAQNLQAFFTPAQLETSRQARVPGTSGVNYIGPAIQAAGSVLQGALA